MQCSVHLFSGRCAEIRVTDVVLILRNWLLNIKMRFNVIVFEQNIYVQRYQYLTNVLPKCTRYSE